MKRSLRRFITVFLVVVLCFGATACSKNDSPSPTSEASLQDGTFEGEGNGNNGKIKVAVTVADGKISNIELLEHNETPGLGDTAMDSLSTAMVKNNTSNIDTVSGATSSSIGLVEAVNMALKAAGATDEFLSGDTAISTSTVLEESEYTFDVVVIGGGGAGLSASVSAADEGAKVVVLEKTSSTGGNTLVSGGALNVAGSEEQKTMGIEDDVETFISDTLDGGDNLGNPELVRYIMENAHDGYEWLVNDIGVEFMDDRVQQFGGHAVPRAVVPVGNTGGELTTKLEKVAREKGVEIFTDTKAMELISDESGKIVGVKAENQGNEVTVHANYGVIIASGGFGANVEMREKYNPDYGAQYMTTCVPASTGDGIVMAEEVNANLVNMDQIQVYPTCNPNNGIISYVANSRFDGGILVNKEGLRFTNEGGRRDHISDGIISQSDGYGYLLWGQEIESIGKMTEIHSVEYEELLANNVLYKVETLEEAAKSFGIDEATMIQTVETYNKYCDEGVDPDFAKTGAMNKIETGPFYIQKVVPSTHHTMGGIQINTSAQVLNKEGELIPNLYAAGEVTGGVHGTNRLGGNAITDIVVMGRTAGKTVVEKAEK